MSVVDCVSLASTINVLVAERERLFIELASLQQRHATELEHLSALVTLLRRQNESLQHALHSISHLHGVIDGVRAAADAEADDDEESLLELYELRRWKREFSIEQTRGLVNTIESLRLEISTLRAAACACGRPS
jgi:hypothetical protein